MVTGAHRRRKVRSSFRYGLSRKTRFGCRAPSPFFGTVCDPQALHRSGRIFVPKRNRGIAQMKQHRYHRGISEAAAALGEEAKLRGLISDVGRVVRILDGNISISTEEERASVSDPSSPAYPIRLRIMAARRDNLKETLSALERRLAPRPAEVVSPCGSIAPRYALSLRSFGTVCTTRSGKASDL